MEKTWGNIPEDEARTIRSVAKKITDQEIAERFQKVGEEIKFKIFVKSDRSIA